MNQHGKDKLLLLVHVPWQTIWPLQADVYKRQVWEDVNINNQK